MLKQFVVMLLIGGDAFNNPSWFGGFGCTADIDDGKFPGKKVKHDKDD